MLDSEEAIDNIDMPPFIDIVKDVTLDKYYKTRSLAYDNFVLPPLN